MRRSTIWASLHGLCEITNNDGEVVKVDPTGPLFVQAGGATELSVDAALGGADIECAAHSG
jgi:hypothetical protein